MPSSVKSTITTLVFLGLLSSLTKSASAQDDFEPYTRLPDSQIVELYIEFNGEYANIFIYNMPEEVLGNSLIVRNLQNTCFGGTEITGKQFWIDMGNQYHYTDTFIVYFSNMYTDMLPYPAEVLLPGRSTTKISFGKDCYQLLCEPQNDPWMPSSHTPFLFKKNGYYLNPDNGRIKKGGRALNSGRFDNCELEHWPEIHPDLIYYDKQANKYKGSELIQLRRLEMTEWDFD